MDKQQPKNYIFPLCVLLLIAVCFGSVLFGSVTLSPADILSALRGENATASVILFSLRLPRLLAALLAGMALAVAGHILQTVTDNPLCAPHIIGVNAGAGFAVMCVLCFLPFCWYILPLAACIGALTATALTLCITRHSRHKKATVILAGVAVSALLNAAISFLSLRYPDVLSSYLAFSVGGFAGVGFTDIGIPAIVMIMALTAVYILAPRISILALGDDIATTLGVRVRILRTVTIMLCAILCAMAVSFAGLLGFVGLIVPHCVRHLYPAPLRAQLPLTVLCGGILTALADLAGRIMFSPSELPAGMLLALLGAPFFVYLLIRRERHDYTA